MIQSFNYLFQYLEKEKIQIDKTEFLFQVQSHPDYPSLLALADTLTFFNIQNGVARVAVADIESLPERFIALLKEENNQPPFCFVEKKDNRYFATKDEKKLEISKTALESKWSGIVLLVENETTEPVPYSKKNNLFWILPLFSLLLFLAVLWFSQESIQTKIFFPFPIVGVLFSIAALKDLFGTNSELLNSFCNITASTSCATVVGSSKWKIFEIVNFSDLSMVFFTSQFLSLLVFLFLSNATAYFVIQELLLVGAVPVLLASVYYQKFVEKKWCPICLVIISIILLELGYVLFLPVANFDISIQGLLVFGLVLVVTASGWSTLKKILKQQKELKEFQLKANRFYRNYENFKTILISKDMKDLVVTPIVLGNPTSKTQITIITNPFCRYCKDAHDLLNEILDKNNPDLHINVIIKADLPKENEENKLFYRNLMNVYLQKGNLAFRVAFHDWFKIKNIKNWLDIHQTLPMDTLAIDTQYDKQIKWCEENDFNFTPALFINGYLYPNCYEREALPYFINELIEDNKY